MLPAWLVAVLLGIVEGLTEFLPVSSTGHLLVAEHWLISPELQTVAPLLTSDFFNIVVQCGAVVAVLPLFRSRLEMLARWKDPRSRDLLLKIGVAFGATGVGGLILDKLHFKLPETVPPVASALIIGGIGFLLAERWVKGRSLSDDVSWSIAGGVAFAQLLAAVFPGTSRSGATILVALLLGANRRLATEFSFLVGIPTLLAAGALKGLKELRHPSGVFTGQADLLLIAAFMSALVSFVAVRWLLRYIQTHSFAGFGVYRIAFGALLLLAVLAS
jgi:undecaprenyl-diphosphatase